MQLMSGLSVGFGMLIAGFALLWLAMPTKFGDSPRFLRNQFVMMIYPAIVLTFMVIGVAELLMASLEPYSN